MTFLFVPIQTFLVSDNFTSIPPCPWQKQIWPNSFVQNAEARKATGIKQGHSVVWEGDASQKSLMVVVCSMDFLLIYACSRRFVQQTRNCRNIICILFVQKNRRNTLCSGWSGVVVILETVQGTVCWMPTCTFYIQSSQQWRRHLQTV